MFCTECGTSNLNEAKFCISCGNKFTTQSSPTNQPNVDAKETIKYVLRPKSVILGLNDGKWNFDLCDIYKEMIGAKTFDDIIFDAIFTDKRILIRPVSKSPQHLWMLGALITPGLASTADLIGKRLTSFLSSSATALVGNPIDAEVVASLPYWSINSETTVKESMPSLWNNAITIIYFKDNIKFKNTQVETKLGLVFDGSASLSKKQFSEFTNLAKLCKIDTTKISKI